MAEAAATNAPNRESRIQYHNRRWSALKQDRSSWISHWRDLADHVMPRRFRYLAEDQNRGEKQNKKIINSTGTLAHRTLKSGMQAGITSPARPWFKLKTPDASLNEMRSVKVWLDTVEARMQEVLSRSNFYNVMPSIYGDLGLFGTGALGAFEDDETVLRFYSFPPGSYAAGQSNRLLPDTFYRQVSLTVQQLAQEFGAENLTQGTRSLYESRQLSHRVSVIHAVEPNLNRDPSKADSQNKKYLSIYFEEGATEDKYLRVSGFDENPIMVARWEVVGEDTYGSACPGMVALGDVRQLQLMEKRKAQALDKLVDPPLKAPTAMHTQPISLNPGDVSYYNEAEGGQGFGPLYEINPRLNELYQEQRVVEDRINSAFYADLFLMLANDQRSNITAREVQERHEEKLLMLGPVLEKVHDELLDPAIDRTFNVMMRRGEIPEPPPELEGMDLRVEYVSVLAQAQQLAGVSGLERSLGFVGQIASYSPESIDKIDTDKAIESYWDMVGAPAAILRSQEDVNQIRQRRRQQEQMQQQLEASEQAAETGKTLSETATSGGTSALQRLLGV